jgi:hypothetical protein
MDVRVNRIGTGFVGDYCYTHARGAFKPDGFGIITTQPLRLSGSDIFYGMEMLKSFDGGESWSEIVPCKNLTRKSLGGGYEMGICDATPMYHKATGKIILIGYKNTYLNDASAPYGTKNGTAYSVYDEKTGDFGELFELELPDSIGEDYYFCANGCGQCFELSSGDILIPVGHQRYEPDSVLRRSVRSSSSVIRASFDGERLRFVEVGEPVVHNVGRGIYEPSITHFSGKYYLCMRTDDSGFVSVSDDGLHFGEPRELCFDDGEVLGSYNTQQHWIAAPDALYIVYTRRGAGNDHIFRHRAPLFIAKYDEKRMCVIRESEKIAVPERGARLGNFGCVSVDSSHGFVIASEWMQTTDPDPFNYKRCMEYGSDNSIFVSKIIF